MVPKNFKRDPVKFVRDKAKGRYKKADECFICGSKEKLDFHHYYTLTPLFNKWLKTNKISINTDEDVIEVRDRFIEEHMDELYVHTVTLCHDHHLKLHSLYGKDPILSTAPKQERWVNIQREKYGLPKLDI
jgi:hypothetical protein